MKIIVKVPKCVITACTGQRDKPTRQDDKHDTSIWWLRPIAALPETVFIPSSFRKIESVLLDTNEEHTFKDPYDIVKSGRSAT